MPETFETIVAQLDQAAVGRVEIQGMLTIRHVALPS